MRKLEEIARAIYEVQGTAYEFAHAGETERAIAMAQAFAAVATMQGPTPAMCEYVEDNFDRNGDNIAVCWRAMIDSILSEEDGE